MKNRSDDTICPSVFIYILFIFRRSLVLTNFCNDVAVKKMFSCRQNQHQHLCFKMKGTVLQIFARLLDDEANVLSTLSPFESLITNAIRWSLEFFSINTYWKLQHCWRHFRCFVKQHWWCVRTPHEVVDVFVFIDMTLNIQRKSI